MIYNIIEVANTHGGSVEYLMSLIDEYDEYRHGFGIKFQPFEYKSIATEDYEFYSIYKSLYITKVDWERIIDKASRTKDIWLDIFDSYSIAVLMDNLDKVVGIKLQSSVIYNQVVLKGLSEVDLKDKMLIINVAAQKIENIKERISWFEKNLSSKEILVEVGFQGYPTDLKDAGLSKISVLKKHLSNRIVFADHVDGSSDDAVDIPLVAGLIGADVVEKHVMHSELKTKYDVYSSMIIKRYDEYISKQERYKRLLGEDFINNRERDYLKKTIQIPILKNDVNRGSIIGDNDLLYKRSGKSGLNTTELVELRRGYNILSQNKIKGDTLCLEDFRKANIAAIIACRLKSKRLPKKALLKIGDLTSIELCIKNTLKFSNVNHTILATSTLKQDDELIDYTYRDDVIFHRGDPDDVIQRYLDICDKLRIDVIVRVTGDCVFHSKDVFEYLLKSHFEKGAEYTSGVGASIGTNLEIINVNALRRIKTYFGRADYSEYMTWYFVNNPEYFNINMVDLPKELCGKYRLTLDYEEDLIMFNRIQEHFNTNKIKYSIIKLNEFLGDNPNIAKINAHISQKYSTDKSLIDKLNRVTKIRP